MAPARAKRRARGRAAPAATAGKKTWTITVPMRAPSAPAAARALRGRAGIARGPARAPLIGGIVKKIIRFFVFTVLDLVGEALLHAIVRKAETRGTHEGFKRVTGDRFPAPKDPPIATWDFIDRGKRILVFIHGTFSNCQGGFADLEGDALAALRQIYGDNILAFDHWTLTKSPMMNANDFMRALPDGDLKFDLVTHSRGGLVARALTETRDQPQVRFERAVFVGTPNAGTPLADPERLKQCLDILTSLFKLLPTFAVFIVIDVLVAVVQWLASRGVGGLPGLVAQNPASEFLRQLNRPETDTDAIYAAVTANFEPDEGFRSRLIDAGADFLFQKNNDLVVPTESVTSVDPGAAPPPLVAEHTLRFEGSRAHHGNYFEQASTVSFLLQTLR
jgi:pimeloyl-ACP methyl ester carboxylesterase